MFTAWRSVQNWLLVHVRCIITAHRIRIGYAEAWIPIRHGKRPIVLLTSPRL